MKTMSVLFLIIALAVSNAGVLWSQTSAKTDDAIEKALCCHGKMEYNIPDLTDEQKKKIDELQVAHLKEVNYTKALLREKEAHLRTLQVADKPDNAAINKTIDEITALKNDLMKKHEAHRQAVRSLLTDKQKAVFDAKGCCSKHDGKGCKGNCGGACKGKGCAGKGEHKGCGSQPAKGKGCCHRN